MTRSRRFVDYILDRSLLLPIGAALALVWANVSEGSYDRFAEATRFFVNDVGMVFFFALAAKEVTEATAPGGALSSARSAAMPVLAACGGMAAPALIFVAVARAAGHPELRHGWAIPCATDIAFSYLAAVFIFGRKHRGVPFLLLLAIADDALGLVLLAMFYPAGEVRLVEFVVVLSAAMVIAYGLRRRRVRSLWLYLGVSGVVSWVAFWRGGIHPALALVPIVPFLPHAARDPGLFVGASPFAHDPLSELEHWWKEPVQLVLFAFGLVNAGVPAQSLGIGTWAVLAGILVGKPVGIVLCSLAGRVFGLRLPSQVGVSDLVVLGCVAAIGFTVSLFFATAAFPHGIYLAQTKMGALLSISGALLALAAAVSLRVGRFAKGHV
jgi:NhaA family Na+:H+ antiporter